MIVLTLSLKAFQQSVGSKHQQLNPDYCMVYRNCSISSMLTCFQWYFGNHKFERQAITWDVSWIHCTDVSQPICVEIKMHKRFCVIGRSSQCVEILRCYICPLVIKSVWSASRLFHYIPRCFLHVFVSIYFISIFGMSVFNVGVFPYRYCRLLFIRKMSYIFREYIHIRVALRNTKKNISIFYIRYIMT